MPMLGRFEGPVRLRVQGALPHLTDPAPAAGMTPKEVAVRLPAVLRRLNPA